MISLEDATELTFNPFSWFTAIEEAIRKLNWDLQSVRGDVGYWEYTNPKREVRTIVLRRYNASWSPGYIINPNDPPTIWSLWAPSYPAKLFGYFEEPSVAPSKKELRFFLDIVDRWLIKQQLPIVVKQFAQTHPHFFDSLPPHRKPLPKLLTCDDKIEDDRAFRGRWKRLPYL